MRQHVQAAIFACAHDDGITFNVPILQRTRPILGPDPDTISAPFAFESGCRSRAQ
jgi:hypothetical protein